MQRKWLIKIGAPILALSLVAACGMNNEEDPAGEDEAPLNQEEDSPDMNGDNQDDPQLENGGNGTNEDGTDTNQGDTNGMDENGANEDDNPLNEEDNN